MSKIIYLTTAVHKELFKDYLKLWKVSPNLSNQNFHYKLIKALSLFNEVEVISIRPINANFEIYQLSESSFVEDNIIWKYPFVSANRINKYLFLNKRIRRVKSSDKGIVLVDALNYSLLRAAIKIYKNKGYKVIGICTDNPINISFTKKSYSKKILDIAKELDGYITLNEAINNIYSTDNKPYIIIDGVNEEYEKRKELFIDGQYIYFGGSLMEKYGVYNLIEAYKSLNLENIKLVLCGHHADENKLKAAIKDNANIIYLGPIDYEKNTSLIQHALFSVNPRPIDPQIDKYSIPSKTLESLAMKCLNVTVNNEYLKQNYGDYILWSNSSSVIDLKEALLKAINIDKKEKEKLIEEGYKKVMSRTSLINISKNVTEFLSKFSLN